jgi:hypothetical protein
MDNNKANTLNTLTDTYEEIRQIAVDYDLDILEAKLEETDTDNDEEGSDKMWTAVGVAADALKAIMTEEDWATYEDEIQDEQGR